MSTKKRIKLNFSPGSAFLAPNCQKKKQKKLAFHLYMGYIVFYECEGCDKN